MEKLKKFADDINYNLELDPDTVKEKLEGGLIGNDPERGEVYKIKPVFIANDPAYSPLPPWDHSECVSFIGAVDDFLIVLYFSQFMASTTRILTKNSTFHLQMKVFYDCPMLH